MWKIDYFWFWHVFSQLLESKKWGKLTSFGGDMFLSQFLESKKWGKLTSFGVDMCLSQLLLSKKWWKLTSFGVDMFLSQLLESKKCGKLTSFGVDMFLSQLLESKKWWKLTSFGVDMCFLNCWNPKNVKNWLVLVLTDWNLEPHSPKYRKIMTSDSKLLPKPPEMGQVLSSG